MNHVSDIKLIRTDTTLDLSQKAEKGMLFPFHLRPFSSVPLSLLLHFYACGIYHLHAFQNKQLYIYIYIQ